MHWTLSATLIHIHIQSAGCFFILHFATNRFSAIYFLLLQYSIWLQFFFSVLYLYYMFNICVLCNIVCVCCITNTTTSSESAISWLLVNWRHWWYTIFKRFFTFVHLFNVAKCAGSNVISFSGNVTIGMFFQRAWVGIVKYYLPPLIGADVAQWGPPPGTEDDGAVGQPAPTGLSRHGGDDLSHDCRAVTPVRQPTLVPAAMTTANQYISI